MPAPDGNPVTAIASREVILFEGPVWRAHGQRYGATSYEGSRRTTGRYNRGPDRFPEGPIWPVLYLALGRDVCIAELIRNIEPVALERLNNYRVSELHITLSVIVDCTDLAALGLEEDDLLHDRDWEIPQELAEIAIHARYEGMIVPSASRMGNNLIVFPEQLRPSSMIEVINFVEPQSSLNCTARDVPHPVPRHMCFHARGRPPGRRHSPRLAAMIEPDDERA